MEHSFVELYLEIGVGFMIVKMLFDTVVSASLKLKNGRDDHMQIPIREWRDLQTHVTNLRLDVAQIKTLMRETIRGKT